MILPKFFPYFLLSSFRGLFNSSIATVNVEPSSSHANNIYIYIYIYAVAG